MHGNNMVSVYKNIDPSLLPDEYLPDDYTGPRIGSCQQIIGKVSRQHHISNSFNNFDLFLFEMLHVMKMRVQYQ